MSSFRDLGRIGLRFGHRTAAFGGPEAVEAAALVEELGFGSIWLNADRVLARGADVADATSRIVLATSVASIWIYDALELAAAFGALRASRPNRFLLGVGVSHASIVEQTAPGRVYGRPLTAMEAWLDELDASPHPVPVDERVVAAISPRMLEIARERSAGSHPYLMPVAHTREARAALGPGKLLAPAIPVHLGTDAQVARAVGRQHICNPYLTLPNYARNWLRHGFEDADLEHGGSDRLIDALVAWGDAENIAARTREQLEAGADHVVLQILTEDPAALPITELRELAGALALVVV